MPGFYFALKGLLLCKHTVLFCAAFSDVSFVFPDAIYAIKGSDEQKSFLLNLTGLLNSTLYGYLHLMIGSSLGIEREQRFVAEVFQFPFVCSDTIANQVEQIQLRSKHEDFTVAQDVSEEIENLNLR